MSDPCTAPEGPFPSILVLPASIHDEVELALEQEFLGVITFCDECSKQSISVVFHAGLDAALEIPDPLLSHGG